MQLPNTLRSALLTLALAAATGAPLSAASWYEHYAAAEKALSEQAWPDAVAELNQALEKRADSGARVRTYGMKVIAYFPYLKLGIAYYHLGQLEASLNAFDTEERLGAIAGSDEHLRELQRYRGLVVGARDQAREQELARVDELVGQSLEQARGLQADGRLAEAAAAVGRALAVDPDHAEASAYLDDLRAEMARRQEEGERQARRAGLVERGQSLLSDGSFGEAASVLQQAADLGEDGAVTSLLERAREGLRRQLEASASSEGERSIQTRLEDARSLQARGLPDQALVTLQGVLALDPGNAEAATLEAELLAARKKAAREAELGRRLQGLLESTREALAAGRVEETLSAANQILALDPGNGEALAALTAAYRRLNSSLLGTAPPGNIPPAISFADRRTELDDGSRAERVQRHGFRLNGIVIDEAPVEIVATDSGGAPLAAAVRERPVGALVITEFSLDTGLDPGLNAFRLTATDAEGVLTSSEYAVLYDQPLLAASWFRALAVAAAVLALGAVFAGRAVRRRRLRRRRFNPYVAGAPVLDEKLFFGRQGLIDRILQTIHNNSLLLHGERRIGKTSIQHHLHQRLRRLDDPEYEFFPVYIDLQGVPEERFFASVADDVFQELEPYLDGLQPSRPRNGDDPYRLFVRDLHAVVKTLERRSDKRARLVLLIDEVDELNDYDPRINQRLRSLFMKSFAERLVAVVSGVEIRKRWERETSPWYNFFEELEVTPFGPEDARALVETPIRGIFQIDEDAVERILEITACRPYRIQRLCMAVVNRMHEQRRQRITADDVEAVGRSAAEAAS